MLIATEGIVLNITRYGEQSIIANVYTKEFGRRAYIINAARSKKGKNRQVLQPLFLVELVAYHKDQREIQRVKEIKNFPVYQNIPFDISKSSQALFIAEILNKTLREEESSYKLYDFLKNSFLFLDLSERSTVNFHLLFLFRLSEYLGFLPDMRKTGFEGWFDMQKGTVVAFEPSHPYFAHKQATEIFSKLATMKIQESESLKMSKEMRGYLISKLVEYYSLHLENMGEIKSLKVLHDVFTSL